MNRTKVLAGAVLAIACAMFRTGSLGAQQAALPDGYAGSETCTACHQQQYDAFLATKKGPLFLKHPQNATQQQGCEGCHGPGQAHVESGGENKTGMISFGAKSTVSVERRNEVCTSCHSKSSQAMWAGGQHEARGVACTSCHSLKNPASERGALKFANQMQTCGQCHQQQRGAMQRFAHMPVREGKMECSSCHNPHGTAGEKLLVSNTVNETCYSCHQEKRGPFMWEHAPVTESCSNCHDPHGSSNPKQLVASMPRLCQRCHDENRHPTRPYAGGAASSRFVQGRQCVNCHSAVHGSNHPSGATFTR